MKIDYDPDGNAAYITLGAPLLDGQAKFQSDIIATPRGRGQIILDFDDEGRLLGVEVLSARELLAPALLQAHP